MKNVTISLPDDVYRRARVKAAERDTSLSGLVRDFLTSLSAEETDFERRRRVQDGVLGTIKRFRGGDRVDRDEVHRRGSRR